MSELFKQSYRSLTIGHLLAIINILIAFDVEAQLITKRVTVQPIQMWSTDGSQSANPSLTIFEQATDKIWAQAGIDFSFLPAVTYSNTTYLNIEAGFVGGNSFGGLANVPGHGQNADPNVINLWFVKTISGGAYGFSHQSFTNNDVLTQRNGVSISDAAFSYGGTGMLDIFAYEIGRNLGLDQDLHGQPSDPVNLMKPSGPYPTTLSQIHPDGAGYGHITQEQIDMALKTSFVVNLPPSEWYTYGAVPEPGAIATVTGALLLGFFLLRRRFHASNAAGIASAARIGL